MKNFRIEFKWAMIFSIFTLLWMYVERILGWHDELISKHAVYTNFIAIPYVIIYIFALIDKRKSYYKGIMSWMQGLISGAVISAMVAVLAPVVQYITNTIITPDYFQNAINYTVESGNTTRENAEKFFNLSSYMIQAVFGSLAMGIVTSAIVAIFVKKKPQEIKSLTVN